MLVEKGKKKAAELRAGDFVKTEYEEWVRVKNNNKLVVYATLVTNNEGKELMLFASDDEELDCAVEEMD